MGDRLPGGALRFATARCTFVVSRVAPGALHVAIAGDDRGELGTAVFAELEREWARFELPLTLWVDARRASAPADAVRDAWAGWFARQRTRLAHVSMLVPGAVLDLTVRVVRQLSGTEAILDVASEAAAFARSLEAAAPGAAARLGGDRGDETPVRVERTGDRGVVRLADGSCAYEYRRPSPAVLRLDIQGRDAGHLGALPLDELMAQQENQQKPGALFVDASGAASVEARVRAEWVAFLKAHRDDFGTTSILAGSRLMQLTFNLAREESQAGQRMRIYTDGADFAEDLRRQVGR